MLIAPLWWLQQITADQSNLKTRLEIIVGFILVFGVGMATVTVAKAFEVLAATAAYVARVLFRVCLLMALQICSSVDGLHATRL